MDVELRDLQFDREGRRVLDIPRLHLRGGAATAILGPNGSGKTTLLRLIAGLERSASGTITLRGQPVVTGRDVAYLFQEQIFLRRTVRENLELGLRMRGVVDSDIRARVDDAVTVLDIEHLLGRRADHLSGGEGRRVDLARALCLRAPLVLLDEPLEGLDRTTHSRLLDQLPQLLTTFDATTVLVTHNQDEALRLADDVVIIVNGQVRAAGPKRDVVLNPRTAAVAEVLGYTVIAVDGRRFAVPPRMFSIAPGGWPVDVEQVLDLVESQEIIGRIGASSVRIALDPAVAAPRRGDRITVQAATAYELE